MKKKSKKINSCQISGVQDLKKIISIGNLSMGGAGKTPFAEYLIKLLSAKYKVALISRGYKSYNSSFSFIIIHKYQKIIYCGRSERPK